jgi:hypothetical protein
MFDLKNEGLTKKMQFLFFDEPKIDYFLRKLK